MNRYYQDLYETAPAAVEARRLASTEHPEELPRSIQLQAAAFLAATALLIGIATVLPIAHAKEQLPLDIVKLSLLFAIAAFGGLELCAYVGWQTVPNAFRRPLLRYPLSIVIGFLRILSWCVAATITFYILPVLAAARLHLHGVEATGCEILTAAAFVASGLAMISGGRWLAAWLSELRLINEARRRLTGKPRP